MMDRKTAEQEKTKGNSAKQPSRKQPTRKQPTKQETDSSTEQEDEV